MDVSVVKKNYSARSKELYFRIGHVEIYLLNDGLIWLDGGGAFGLVPRVMWETLLPPDKLNRVPLSLNCLLIRSEGKTILIDTGLGDHLTEKLRQVYGLVRDKGGLLQELAHLGFMPESVDIVINTHLHADHCGGNTTYRAGDRKIVPAFPNAEYWIQRLEWADAAFPNERTRATYKSPNFMPLHSAGQLRLLNGDTRVTNEVRTVITRGHTRAHQSVVIESEGKTALYTGDMATLAVHFERLAWVTAYDVEPLETIETKRRWRHWALERDAIIVFPHDTKTPLARLRTDNEGQLCLDPINYVPTQESIA
jgi:glyoxylase-like metal-dependent hydrolase (beta-lactamase superfamily II)